MHIHITNLHLNTNESDLLRMFTPFGEVKQIELIRDKLTNRSRGRAFVHMPNEKEGLKALTTMDGSAFMGKMIHLSEVTYDPGLGSHLFKFSNDQ